MAETDTYGLIKKMQGTSGGMLIHGLKDADGSNFGAIVIAGRLAEAPDTTKNSTGRCVVEIHGVQTSGNADDGMTSGGNVFGISTINNGDRDGRVFIIDESGDYHYDGSGSPFDDYEDAQLVRALSLAISKDVIRTEWDESVRYNEASLIEAGILGDTVANGGLVNGAQLQRLHNGAIWQLHQKIETQALQIESLESKLKLLEM
jgi:hypothetical protein